MANNGTTKAGKEASEADPDIAAYIKQLVQLQQ
jgi:hypothetical protein